MGKSKEAKILGLVGIGDEIEPDSGDTPGEKP